MIDLARQARRLPAPRRAFLPLLALFLALSAPIQAAEEGAFNEAAADAYRHVRAVVFYLRTGNPAPASLELDQALAGWRRLTAAFAVQPPGAFADDPEWQARLAEIGGRLEAGQAALEAGDLEAASGQLKPIRWKLSELRARSRVRVFSDCIDEATRRMDRLWRYRHAPPDFGSAEAVAALRAENASLTEHMARCDAEAGEGTRDHPEFRATVDGMLAALARIDKALDSADELLLINTLRELRAFDLMLWLRFG